MNSCGNGTAHVELWGSLVLAGTDNEQPTAADCCRSCAEYEPTLDVLNGAQCNAWVWHLDRTACVLAKVPKAGGAAARIKAGARRAAAQFEGAVGERRESTDQAVR